VKTFWLISLIGQLTDDYEMFTAAQRRAARILDWAYLPDTGSWARGLNKHGWLDENKEWWTYCELDQVAGALAMNDPFYARYIAQTYKYWFKHMVDHQDHEIWHWVDGKTNLPDPGFPKQHAWKNAMHSFEHVLVSYLVCQQLHRNEVPLYYAFEDKFVEQCKPDEEPDQHGVKSLKIKEKAALREINPYFYNGKVKEEKLHKKPVKSLPNRYEVVFTDVAVGSLAWPPRRGGRLSAADY
jgi:hypothetical protein